MLSSPPSPPPQPTSQDALIIIVWEIYLLCACIVFWLVGMYVCLDVGFLDVTNIILDSVSVVWSLYMTVPVCRCVFVYVVT